MGPNTGFPGGPARNGLGLSGRAYDPGEWAALAAFSFAGVSPPRWRRTGRAEALPR